MKPKLFRAAKKDRIKACELAARVMAGQPECPKLWSVTVFFESYIVSGAKGTMKNFGPKRPAKLRIVRSK